MNPQPTGCVESGTHLVLERAFRAPVPAVWAAVTEPGRLARWFGTWTGDPASGRVSLVMTAEGQTEPEPVLIRRCDPPVHLALTLPGGGEEWLLELDLREHDGGSTLRLAQQFTGPADLASIGPGWEYYLDRLVAAESGGDPGAVDFERDYHPAMAGYYEALGPQLRFPA